MPRYKLIAANLSALVLLQHQAASALDKSPAQIAINWLIFQKNVVTLAKMVNEKHLAENLGSFDWEMEKEDIEKLRQDFPGQKSISGAVPLQ